MTEKHVPSEKLLIVSYIIVKFGAYPLQIARQITNQTLIAQSTSNCCRSVADIHLKYILAKPINLVNVVLLNDAATHYMYNAMPYIGAVDIRPRQFLRIMLEPLIETHS